MEYIIHVASLTLLLTASLYIGLRVYEWIGQRRINASIERQMKEWCAFAEGQNAKGKCEYSGLDIKECMSWLCDCERTLP
jgi:hypothetical protein